MKLHYNWLVVWSLLLLVQLVAATEVPGEIQELYFSLKNNFLMFLVDLVVPVAACSTCGRYQSPR